MQLAGIPKRIFAFIVDEILMAILFTVLLLSVNSDALLVAAQASGQDPLAINKVITPYLPYLLLVKFLYHMIFVYFYGASLGKLAFKLRVAPIDNSAMGLGAAAFRAAIRLVSEAIFYIGFLLAFFTKSRQTLQDLVAKTLVVEIEKK